MKDYPRKLSGFPDERSEIALSLFTDLRFLIFRSSLVANFNRDAFLKKMQAYKDTYSILFEDDDHNFLIRITPHTLLHDRRSFLLRVPANPEQELMITLENTDTEKRRIDVFIDDRYEETSYKTLTLGPGEQKLYNIPLPVESSEMAPLVFRFVPDKPFKVMLHERQLKYSS